jgi:hypothetical protein
VSYSFPFATQLNLVRNIINPSGVARTITVAYAAAGPQALNVLPRLDFRADLRNNDVVNEDTQYANPYPGHGELFEMLSDYEVAIPRIANRMFAPAFSGVYVSDYVPASATLGQCVKVGASTNFDIAIPTTMSIDGEIVVQGQVIPRARLKSVGYVTSNTNADHFSLQIFEVPTSGLLVPTVAVSSSLESQFMIDPTWFDSSKVYVFSVSTSLNFDPNRQLDLTSNRYPMISSTTFSPSFKVGP